MALFQIYQQRSHSDCACMSIHPLLFYCINCISSLRQLPIGGIGSTCDTHKVLSAIRTRSELLSVPIPEFPSFRVTCTRQGRHMYSSPEAAGHLGYGLLQSFPEWRVNLKVIYVHLLCT